MFHFNQYRQSYLSRLRLGALLMLHRSFIEERTKVPATLFHGGWRFLDQIFLLRRDWGRRRGPLGRRWCRGQVVFVLRVVAAVRARIRTRVGARAGASGALRRLGWTRRLADDNRIRRRTRGWQGMIDNRWRRQHSLRGRPLRRWRRISGRADRPRGWQRTHGWHDHGRHGCQRRGRRRHQRCR